ncbi:MAG TPA: hypothetical protein VKK81_03265 [Candidatus Binatia bacterium]|nr:hypothetical protein [Candidatus Binatia bacterium]
MARCELAKEASQAVRVRNRPWEEYPLFVQGRYNNPNAEDLKEVVLAPSPAFVYKNQAATFPHGTHMAEKVEDAVTQVIDFPPMGR